MYKISNDFLPLFMKDMMTEIYIQCNTKSTIKVKKTTMETKHVWKKSNFKLPVIKMVSYGFESIWYIGPEIGKLVPGNWWIKRTIIINPIPTGGGSKVPTALDICIQNSNYMYWTVQTPQLFLNSRLSFEKNKFLNFAWLQHLLWRHQF